MFIRLTNAFINRKGDPLIINVNHIASVYENHEEGGSLNTTVYSNPNLFWTVEESVEQVWAKINAALGK